jgi:hypothetical protein
MSVLANLFMPDYLRQAPAWFYNRVLVGAGPMLTPAFMTKYGITHVINCADDEACPAWYRKSFPHNYVCINAQDSLFVNILDWYPKFEYFLHKFLRESAGTVFVHCQCGINRSGFLAMTYVCKNFGLTFEDIFFAGRGQRPVLFQNPIFMRQVQEFIKNGYLPSAQNPREPRE